MVSKGKDKAKKSKKMLLGVVCILVGICCISGAVFNTQRGQEIESYRSDAIAGITGFVEGLNDADYSSEVLENMLSLVDASTRQINSAKEIQDVKKIKDETIDAIKAMPTLLEESQISLVAELKQYVEDLNENDYSGDSFAAIDDYMKSGITDIEKAGSEDSALLAYDSTITQIEEVKTLTAIAKEDALSELESFYIGLNRDDYSAVNKIIIDDTYTSAKADIETSASADSVNKVKDTALKRIQKLPKESPPDETAPSSDTTTGE